MDKRISNFHLGRLLYDGDRCEVYEARYAQAGGVVQPAAIKVLKPEFACIGEELRAFLREIDWARGLRHSLFPRIMEAGEHDGHYFLAMDRLDGWTLEAVLRDLAVMQVRLPCQVALTLIHQVADGLHSLHEHCEDNTHLGVVHLGIEPSNIMLCREGTARVLDFGETMAASVGDIALAGTDTTAYQAPERLRMLPLDRRADIYSLGKVLEDMSACMDPAEVDEGMHNLIARACAGNLSPDRKPSNLSPRSEMSNLVAMPVVDLDQNCSEARKCAPIRVRTALKRLQLLCACQVKAWRRHMGCPPKSTIPLRIPRQLPTNVPTKTRMRQLPSLAARWPKEVPTLLGNRS